MLACYDGCSIIIPKYVRIYQHRLVYEPMPFHTAFDAVPAQRDEPRRYRRREELYKARHRRFDGARRFHLSSAAIISRYLFGGRPIRAGRRSMIMPAARRQEHFLFR